MTTSSENRAPFLRGERGELLRALSEQRELLLITVCGITDAQAAQRTTVSDLTLGGIVKHITRGEQVWMQIMVKGDGELPEGMLDMGQYGMADDETLTGLLKQYAAAARTTEEAVADLRDLDRSVPLPRTPWSPPETVYWSARRILLHLVPSRWAWRSLTDLSGAASNLMFGGCCRGWGHPQG